MKRFGLTALTVLLALSGCQPVFATYKNEYAKNPEAVRKWFKAATIPGWEKFEKCREITYGKGLPAKVTDEMIAACGQNYAPAFSRIGISGCCEKSERFKTKFVPTRRGDWMYYTDANCTQVGCPLELIRRDVTHTDGIHALDPKDDGLPEFEAMRREGVLFIYRGKPSCFWPPEGGI